MGGENENDVKNLMVVLNKLNVEGIIDYAVESDVTNAYSTPEYLYIFKIIKFCF